MYQNNAYKTYKSNSVTYASKEQLLLMIVDGAVKYAKLSKNAIENKEVKKAHEYLIRTQDIFVELMSSLDMDKAGSWGNDLMELYKFINSQLVQINFKKDINLLNKVIPLIEGVRDMWYDAYKVAKR
jgi:flagellar protein FliS